MKLKNKASSATKGTKINTNDQRVVSLKNAKSINYKKVDRSSDSSCRDGIFRFIGCITILTIIYICFSFTVLIQGKIIRSHLKMI